MLKHITRHIVEYVFIVGLLSISLMGCNSAKVDSPNGVSNEEKELGLDISEDSEISEYEAKVPIGMKTSEQLDVNDLPEEIENMISLCDALNIVQAETAHTYDYTDPSFIWRSIQIAVVNSDWDDVAAKQYDSIIEVENDVVNDYAYALFGKMQTLPAISDDLRKSNSDKVIDVDISNDFNYLFKVGDRGLSKPKVIRVIKYSDASIELNVQLVDAVDDSEIAGFIYNMRSNTRDTSRGARFAYEITSVRTADSQTAELMNGRPYLTMVAQLYYDDVFETEDGRSYSKVTEIPYFQTLGLASEEVNKLNDRINKELMALEYGEPLGESDNSEQNEEASVGEESLEEQKDGEFYRIISYPVSNTEYLQVVSTYEKLPLGEEYGVRSYNYDLINKRALSLEDGLDAANIEESTFVELLNDSLAKDYEQYSLNDCEYQAFVIGEDGSVYFYVLLNLRTESGDDISAIAEYSTAKHSLTIFDRDEEIVDASKEDLLEIPLTHGL